MISARSLPLASVGGWPSAVDNEIENISKTAQRMTWESKFMGTVRPMEGNAPPQTSSGGTDRAKAGCRGLIAAQLLDHRPGEAAPGANEHHAVAGEHVVLQHHALDE